MAMELFVLSDAMLNSTADWQAAIDGEGYPLRLPGDKLIESLKGFLPALLRDTKTGFECSLWPADDLIREMPGTEFGHDWKYALAFRWGGNLNQVPAVWMAATAYAKATNGVVFDEVQGKIYSPVDAQAVVNVVERELPEMEAMLRDLNKS
jgi:hypothetical protein